MSGTRSHAPHPHHPLFEPPTDLAALKLRVAESEAELAESIDRVMDAFQNALDWRKVVAKHPLECALGAAALGFLAAYKPEILGRADSLGRLSENPIKSILNLGAESLVKAAANHFTGGRSEPPAD